MYWLLRSKWGSTFAQYAAAAVVAFVVLSGVAIVLAVLGVAFPPTTPVWRIVFVLVGVAPASLAWYYVGEIASRAGKVEEVPSAVQVFEWTPNGFLPVATTITIGVMLASVPKPGAAQLVEFVAVEFVETGGTYAPFPRC